MWIKAEKKAFAGMYHSWKNQKVVEGTYKGSDPKVVRIEHNSRTYEIRATKTIREQLAYLKMSAGDRIRIEYLGVVGNPPRCDFDVNKWADDVVEMKKSA